MNKNFLNLQIGDVVVAANIYSHDYTHYTIKITSIEYDEDFITETNPQGMHCYGECLDDVSNFDDYITNVDEANYSHFCYHSKETNCIGEFSYTEDSSFSAYKSGYITEEEWEKQSSNACLFCTFNYGNNTWDFIIHKEDIENFYGQKDIDFKKLDVYCVWEDMWEYENYIENTFLTNTNDYERDEI